MAKLSDAEKAERARQRMLDTAKSVSTRTYIAKVVAPIFQRMIRAEAGADRRPYVTAVVNGVIRQVPRSLGQVACVTCGKVEPWSGGLGGMHTGHFVGSRSNAIIFEESNVAPQCSRCNVFNHGEAAKFRLWMEAVRGPATVERLQRLRNDSRQFTRDELVDLRISFAARLKAAEQTMSGSH